MRAARRAMLLLLSLMGLAGTAQDVKFGGLVTFWATQALDSELRRETLVGSQPGGAPYYPLHAGFRENGFVLRRSEIYLSGNLTPTLAWNVAGDPNFSGSIMSDATLTWTPHPEWSFRLGQFKPLQGYEGTIVPATQLFFYDRSILARQFGDKWDRGITLTWIRRAPWGELRVSGGVFNGAGRSADQNAQKDWVARADLQTKDGQRFGVYGLIGKTDAAPGGTVAYVLPGTGAPTDSELLERKDATSSYGLYVVMDRGPWHGEVEVMGGLLGRRYPVLGPAPVAPAQRQHEDQRFLGFVATGVYRHGRHAFTARYDRMDYNQGGRWYGSDPYRTAQGDFTPRFTELVLGVNWALAEEARWRTVHLKLNYVHRRGPLFLSGANRGDSLVAVMQVAF